MTFAPVLLMDDIFLSCLDILHKMLSNAENIKVRNCASIYRSVLNIIGVVE
jgi:hypothetical protein